MGRREVYDCDRCGREMDGPGTVGVDVGTYHDPCDGTQRDHQTVDLCGECSRKALQKFLTALPSFEAGAEWIKEIRRGIKQPGGR